MTFPVQVGPSTITINRDDRVLVCQPDGRILGDDDGFFTRDTRFISGYDAADQRRAPDPPELGADPVLLVALRVHERRARRRSTARSLASRWPCASTGPSPTASTRTSTSSTTPRRPVRLTIEIAILSDFADIFDVKHGQLVRRGELNTRWFRSRGELRTTYVNRDFRRELIVAVERSTSTPQFANGRLVFVATIPPKGVWHTCLKWLPVTRSNRRLVDARLQRGRRAAAQGRRQAPARTSASRPRTRPSIEPGTRPFATSRRCASRTPRSSAACSSRPPACPGS